VISGRHRGCITRITPELDTNFPKIIINMGVEAKTNARTFLPVIGEVQLRFGVPNTKEPIDQILYEL